VTKTAAKLSRQISQKKFLSEDLRTRKEDGTMLFICIYSYEPEKRDKVIKRRSEGLFIPEGAECLGQWSTTEGGRVFTLFELDDGVKAAQWAASWNDLGKFATYPVVDTEELIKAITAQ
jgi:hypothetical protein